MGETGRWQQIGPFSVHDARTGERLADRRYDVGAGSHHYGADENMIVDIFSHLTAGTALPVSILDGLEAGLTAIKIDEARQTRKVIELADTWSQFDSYGLR